MKYTVTAIHKEIGMMVHITGVWESDDAMRKTLEGDGFIITWFTKD